MKQNLLDRLKELPLFEGVPSERLEVLAAHAEVRNYAAGDMIFGEQDRPGGFHVVLDGRVKLYKSSIEGKEQTLYVFGAGEPFCLCSALRNSRFPGTASALEPSRVLTFSRSAFMGMAESDPSLLLNLLQLLSGRLKQAMDMVESLALKDLPRRIAHYLLNAETAEETGSLGLRVTLPMSHRELAKLAGSTPEALSRTFRKMAEQGLLEIEGRRITVPDRAALEECAENGL